MPVQVVAEDGEDPAQIPLDGHQQAQVQLAVLDDVDAEPAQLGVPLALEGVGGGLLRLARHHCGDVGLILGEQGAEGLIEELGHRAADLGREQAVPVGKGDAQHLLAPVDPVGHAVDGDQAAPGKVVVLIQLPVGGGLHPDVGVLPDNVHPGDVHLVAHGLGVGDVGQVVVAHLPVGGPAGDVVGGPADQHLAGTGDPEHLVILAAEGEELAGQILLEHMAPQLGAQVVLFALLVLGDVAGVAQITQQGVDEGLVGDEEGALHPALLQGVFLLAAQDVHTEDRLRVPLGEDHGQIAQLVGPGGAAAGAAPADGLPQALRQLPLVQIGQHQLLADIGLGHRPGAQPQAEAQEDVALGGGVVGHDVGDGLGIGIEDAVVLQHVVLEQILRRDDVHEALVGGTGGKEPLHLEHIVPLVLHGEEVIPLHPGVPEVGGGPEILVHGLLGGGQTGVVEQVVVILLGDPVGVQHGEGVAAVPLGHRHLIFQGGKGQLGAHAQVAGQVGQQPVLQVFPVPVPAHVGGDPPVVLGGGDLGEAGQEDVGQGVHQTVTVLVGGAEGDALALPPAAADDGVQADLGGGHQLGGLDEHHELHVLEEVAVGLMEGQVVDAGAADDAHVQLLGLVGEHPDVPHIRDVGDGGQSLPAPGRDVLLHRVAAQHDQDLFAPQHHPVHGVEHIGDQVVVEGVVEQDAPLLEQLQAGDQVVVVQLEAGPHLQAHEAAVGLHLGVVALLQLLEQVVVGAAVEQTGVHGGVFRAQLVTEQLRQHLAQQHIVADAVGPVGLAGEEGGHLLLVQAVQEEVHLAHDDQAEHRIEGGGEQLVPIEFAGEEHQTHRQEEGGVVHGLQVGAALAQVAAEIPAGAVRVLFIEGFHAQVVEAAAGPEHHLKHGDQDPLDQDVGQQQDGVAHEQQDIRRVHGLEQAGQHGSQLLHRAAGPAEQAVKDLGQPGPGLDQKIGDQLDQHEDPFADPVQEHHQHHGVEQGEHRHGELPVTAGTLQVGLCVQQGQQKEGKQGQQQPCQPDEGLNHTVPPFSP